MKSEFVNSSLVGLRLSPIAKRPECYVPGANPLRAFVCQCFAAPDSPRALKAEALRERSKLALTGLWFESVAI